MDGLFALCVIAVGVLGVIYVLIDLFSTPRPPPSPPPTPEDYDQEAALHRARARALDAQAAFDDSRAKAALKRAELLEVEQFVQGQHSKGAGNGRR